MSDASKKREAYKTNLIKIYADKPGLRGKVNSHCIMCIYDTESPGTWRKQVEMCTVTSCPLYSVRARASG